MNEEIKSLDDLKAAVGVAAETDGEPAEETAIVRVQNCSAIAFLWTSLRSMNRRLSNPGSGAP